MNEEIEDLECWLRKTANHLESIGSVCTNQNKESFFALAKDVREAVVMAENQKLVMMGKDERIKRLTSALKIILEYDPGAICPLCESGERFEIQSIASEAPGIA